MFNGELKKMEIYIYNYGNDKYQLILPQREGRAISLGNQISKEQVLDKISKIMDLESD